MVLIFPKIPGATIKIKSLVAHEHLCDEGVNMFDISIVDL